MNWWHNIDQKDAEYYQEIAQSLGCESKIRIEKRPGTVDEIIESATKGFADKVNQHYDPDPGLWSVFASDDVDKKQFMNKYDGF